MTENESVKSFGELPTLGHERTRKAEPHSAVDGPSWSSLGLSEAETLRRGEGIRDDGRTDGARRWKAGEEMLGRYMVERELGQGGMGVVYGCFDKTGGVKVAVKCLPPELSHNSVEIEEVRENFQLVVGLRHSNIAGVRTLEKDANGEYYLVMDVAEGENLRAWLRRKWKAGGVSLEEAVGVLRQVASALDYAHGEKVVHRDVKPGNVMIDGRGRVKVLDFGLAAQIRTSLSRASQAYRGTSGTGPYMAPEQWEGQPQDGAADQYALGVMAYEMLAGRLPFKNSELAVLKDAVLHGAVRDIPGVDRRAMGVLRRALAKREDERWGSCGEFVAALAGEREGSGGGRRSARDKTLMGWVAALLGVAAVGAGVWEWMESGRGEPSAMKVEEQSLAEEQTHLQEVAMGVTTEECVTHLDAGQRESAQTTKDENTPQEVEWVTAERARDTAANFSAKSTPVTSPFLPFLKGAILCYDFDDEEAATEDKSGFGNHGTVMGASWRRDEKGNGFFEFDGLPGIVRAPDKTPDSNHDFIRVSGTPLGFPLDDFTISVVCRPDNEGTIVGSGANEMWQREWYLRFDEFGWAWVPGHASGGVGRQHHALSFPGRAGLLQHLVVRRTGRRVEIARNGKWMGESCKFPDSPLPIYSYGLFVGNEELDEYTRWRRWNCMQGVIYHVMIWNRALSNAEAGALWTAVNLKYAVTTGGR